MGRLSNERAEVSCAIAYPFNRSIENISLALAYLRELREGVLRALKVFALIETKRKSRVISYRLQWLLRCTKDSQATL